MNIAELEAKTNEELQQLARELGVLADGAAPKRRDLMMKVLPAHAEQGLEPLHYNLLMRGARRRLAVAQRRNWLVIST
ncbi:MAG: Rho termination factor N-terminal domain-containing protein [Chloroflexi bacterium]|nr:Rho termination factor N-terminal domain-containing protein [Chloroflexota bacterium]